MLTTGITPTEDQPTRPYDQQPGEPDKWYDRFYRFRLLGPSRSLIQCYHQELMAGYSNASTGNGHHGNGHHPLPQQVPGAWKRKAREFDWHRRAAAWDADLHTRSLQRLESTLNRICEAADKAIQYLIDLMCDQLDDPDISITLIHERRMAAKIIIDKAVEIYPLLQYNQVEERHRIPVTEIRIHQPGTESP